MPKLLIVKVLVKSSSVDLFGVEEAWALEIDKRAEQMDSGQVTTIPWEQVRARLFRKAIGTI